MDYWREKAFLVSANTCRYIDRTRMAIMLDKGLSYTYQTIMVLLILFVFGGSLGREIFWDVLSELAKGVISLAIIAAAMIAAYLLFYHHSRWWRKIFQRNKSNRDR